MNVYPNPNTYTIHFIKTQSKQTEKMSYNLRSTSKNISDTDNASINMNKRKMSQSIRVFTSLKNRENMVEIVQTNYNLRPRVLMDLPDYSEEVFECSDDPKDENWVPSLEEEEDQEDDEWDDEDEELDDGDMEVIMSGKKSSGCMWTYHADGTLTRKLL